MNWPGYGGPPSGLFRMNRQSEQARGLRFWVPSCDRMGVAGNEMISGAPISTYGTTGPAGGIIPGYGPMMYSPGSKTNGRYWSSQSYVIDGMATISFWMRRLATVVNAFLFSQSNTFMAVDYNQLHFFGRVSDGTGKSWPSGFIPGANVLYHVVVCYNPTVTISLYVNGRLFGTSGILSANQWQGLPVSWYLFMQNLAGGGSPDLYLGDFRVYDRPLSSGEIYRLYDPATRWELYESVQPEWGKWPLFQAAWAMPGNYQIGVR